MIYIVDVFIEKFEFEFQFPITDVKCLPSIRFICNICWFTTFLLDLSNKMYFYIFDISYILHNILGREMMLFNFPKALLLFFMYVVLEQLQSQHVHNDITWVCDTISVRPKLYRPVSTLLQKHFLHIRKTLHNKCYIFFFFFFNIHIFYHVFFLYLLKCAS